MGDGLQVEGAEIALAESAIGAIFCLDDNVAAGKSGPDISHTPVDRHIADVVQQNAKESVGIGRPRDLQPLQVAIIAARHKVYGTNPDPFGIRMSIGQLVKLQHIARTHDQHFLTDIDVTIIERAGKHIECTSGRNTIDSPLQGTEVSRDTGTVGDGIAVLCPAKQWQTAQQKK